MDASQHNALLPGYSEGEISPDGSRVFFETADALVPQDTNGLSDVYEWENGRIYLISSGQGTSGSNFSGASSNGNDVFITTTDHLAPQDIESATQIYDARVDGGFPYRPFTTGCDSGQCQGPQTPAPVFGAPASATFVGLGNPARPPRRRWSRRSRRRKTEKCKKGSRKEEKQVRRERKRRRPRREPAPTGGPSHMHKISCRLWVVCASFLMAVLAGLVCSSAALASFGFALVVRTRRRSW